MTTTRERSERDDRSSAQLGAAGARLSSAGPVARGAAAVARLFYQLEVTGPRPPAAGPLLLVANHPNSLLDTGMVALATGRPARFLAKSTLFRDPLLGWLVRASGAIPVYRQQDASTDAAIRDGTAARTAANAAMFEAAEAALAAGDAIALFPEGISHARPSLAPLKTGAARLALGAAATLGPFPIVPVGITLDDRAIFRSTGLVVVGPPIAWDDLRDGGPEAVRTLTARIDAALRGVTAGFDSWEDARLVTAAERVHGAAVAAARLGLPGASDPDALASTAPAGRLERAHLGAALLARAHAATGERGEQARAAVRALARALRAHARLLGVLQLTPADLAVPSDLGTAVGWARRRVLLALVAALAALGTVIGWVPYRLTGMLAARAPGAHEEDVLGTAKALVGGVCFLSWTVLLAVLAGVLVAWWAALVVLLVVPALLLLTLVAGEGWQMAWRDARRFLVLRRRGEQVATLRARQARLARQIEDTVALLEAF